MSWGGLRLNSASATINASTRKNKEDAETRILEKLGIESSIFFGLSITTKTALIYPMNQKKLLDHLEKCHIILNNPLYKASLEEPLKLETIAVLKSILENVEDTGIEKLAEYLLLLMTHRNETHGSNYPSHARDLMSCLKKSLSSSPNNKPKAVDELIVDATIALFDTRQLEIQAIVAIFNKYDANIKHDILVRYSNTICKRLDQDRARIASNIERGADDATIDLKAFLESPDGALCRNLFQNVDDNLLEIFMRISSESGNGKDCWLLTTLWGIAHMPQSSQPPAKPQVTHSVEEKELTPL